MVRTGMQWWHSPSEDRQRFVGERAKFRDAASAGLAVVVAVVCDVSFAVCVLWFVVVVRVIFIVILIVIVIVVFLLVVVIISFCGTEGCWIFQGG